MSQEGCWASTLTIRPWMLGWVGLIRACGATATCIWSAYSLRPSHFDFLPREWSNSHTWIAQGVRCLLFDPMGAHSILSRGGRSVPSTVCPPVDNSRGGQSGGWTIRGVVHPTRSKHGVDKSWVEKTTIHRKYFILCATRNVKQIYYLPIRQPTMSLQTLTACK